MPMKFQSGFRLLNASFPLLSGSAEAYANFLFKTNPDHLTLRTDKLQRAMNVVQSNPVLRTPLLCLFNLDRLNMLTVLCEDITKK